MVISRFGPAIARSGVTKVAAALAQQGGQALQQAVQGGASVTRWEYARLESTDRGISVVFTHREAWTGVPPEAFFDTLRRLGDEGWELVAALPLAALAEGTSFQPGMRLQVMTDRWLVFKRPQPETGSAETGTPGAPATPGADVVRSLAGQLLKSKLPVR